MPSPGDRNRLLPPKCPDAAERKDSLEALPATPRSPRLRRASFAALQEMPWRGEGAIATSTPSSPEPSVPTEDSAVWDWHSPSCSSKESRRSLRCTSKNPFWRREKVECKAPSPGNASKLDASLLPTPLRCLRGAEVDAIDHDFELEVQNWGHWRTFLNEAATTTLARQAFQSFDVEAEPPRYARPPPSEPCLEICRSDSDITYHI
eukprot:TRINITY_DN96320_c0_g1_i1.p1 TRINITY_DN96320_c0_g1~~TRINITY_DN96320_c0_g1_i1.p1  ORF type:complete len:206 (-),score=31.72 TRINITY_DN96320_c0_g1_i1:116-733(-)